MPSPKQAPKLSERALAQQIQHAIVKGANGALIDFDDLPLPWRINSYIQSGYHFSTSFRQCGLNIFRPSNESFNIWSHVLGIAGLRTVALRLYHAQDNPQSTLDNAMMTTYFIAALACLGCSVLWHSLKSISSPDILMRCASVDLMGVSMIISATAILTEYTAFYTHPVLQSIYMFLTIFCTLSCLVAVWQPFLRNPEFAWVRVALFVMLGITGFLPFIHLSIVRDLAWTLTFYRPLVIRVIVPILSGAVVYASKFPESLAPGRFDFIGSSHNVWHVAVLITVYGGYIAMEELFEMALSEVSAG